MPACSGTSWASTWLAFSETPPSSRRSITPNGHPATQVPQPLQTSSWTTTVPNSVRNKAPVGHTSKQPALVQCLQTSEDISQRKVSVSGGVVSAEAGFGAASTGEVPIVGMPSETSLAPRSEEHTSELQSRGHLVCRLLLEKQSQ